MEEDEKRKRKKRIKAVQKAKKRGKQLGVNVSEIGGPSQQGRVQSLHTSDGCAVFQYGVARLGL